MKHPQIHGLTEEYARRSATGNNYHLSTLTEYIPLKSPVKEYLADCDVLQHTRRFVKNGCDMLILELLVKLTQQEKLLTFSPPRTIENAT